MSSGERPIGKQPNTGALCPPPPPHLPRLELSGGSTPDQLRPHLPFLYLRLTAKILRRRQEDLSFKILGP